MPGTRLPVTLQRTCETFSKEQQQQQQQQKKIEKELSVQLLQIIKMS